MLKLNTMEKSLIIEKWERQKEVEKILIEHYNFMYSFMMSIKMNKEENGEKTRDEKITFETYYNSMLKREGNFQFDDETINLFTLYYFLPENIKWEEKNKDNIFPVVGLGYYFKELDISSKNNIFNTKSLHSTKTKAFWENDKENYIILQVDNIEVPLKENEINILRIRLTDYTHANKQELHVNILVSDEDKQKILEKRKQLVSAEEN